MRRRFVVQRHEVGDEVHFDFMVEHGPALATWQLEAPLPSSSGEVVRGRRSPDHRPVYLEFEGEISGGRGRVSIVARGEVEDREGTIDERWTFAIGGAEFEIELAGDSVALRCKLAQSDRPVSPPGHSP